MVSMKRAAAIIGPTPSFVRWAIRFDCTFRSSDCDNLPYDTFRQLRSIRELGVGYQRNQVIDGICIHAELNTDSKTARGFPVDEVHDLFGSHEAIDRTCGSCPANVWIAASNAAWAGCYGMFFSIVNDIDWINKFEQVSPGHHRDFAKSTRMWFRIWQTECWDRKNLLPLQNLLAEIRQRESGWKDDELNRFDNAIQCCIENQLELQTELVPRGHSDGVTWVIEPCCSNCHCEMKLTANECDECGQAKRPLPAQKKKVLGLRPYMQLSNLIGDEQTTRLIKKYQSRKSPSD